MDIKKLIEAGAKLSYPYKHSKKDWVSDVTIRKCDISDKILIESPAHRFEYELNGIDEAIKKWNTLAFGKRNLWNKIKVERAKHSKFSEKWHEPSI